MGEPKTSDNIQIKIKIPNPSQERPASSKAPNQDLKDMDVLCNFKIKTDSQNFEHGCTKDQWPYPNKIKMLNPSHKPPASFKAPNEALKETDVLCTFKINIENQNLDHGCIKDQWPYPDQDQDAKPQSGTSSITKAPNEDLKDMEVLCIPKTTDHIQIEIKIQNSSKEPPASSKVPNQDLKDMDVLCTFKMKIERQNSKYGCIKDQWPYPNQDLDAKPQSGTSSVLQNPKWGLKGHGCSLHL